MLRMNPRVDLAFKKLFGSPENKDLLISFINSVVSEADQVADVELLNPYNPANFANDKLSILDIKAKDTAGKYYNIEIQITDEADYDKRALYYWAKLYSEQLKKGMNYRSLRKTIGIHVLNFISIVENDDYHNSFHVTNKETKVHAFKDMELHTIELIKFSRSQDELSSVLKKVKTSLDRWITFLTRSYELEQNHLPKELDIPDIKKALNVMEQINLNSEERGFYDDHLKWLMIEESTLEKAEEKGVTKATLAIAKALLDKGIDPNLIEQTTGLTREEIEKMKEA